MVGKYANVDKCISDDVIFIDLKCSPLRIPICTLIFIAAAIICLIPTANSDARCKVVHFNYFSSPNIVVQVLIFTSVHLMKISHNYAVTKQRILKRFHIVRDSGVT